MNLGQRPGSFTEPLCLCIEPTPGLPFSLVMGGGEEAALHPCSLGLCGVLCGISLTDPLEEGMAVHSSILAWRIPWTEEPGGLQSIGLHIVGHD